MSNRNQASVEVAKEVIDIEVTGLQFMSDNLNENFNDAVSAIVESKGRVIVTGMGKSGIIGKKIAASMASTGTPSFFIHPGEAFHGDLGMIKSEDVILALSNSGETDEVLKLLPFLRDSCNVVISMTGNEKSTLAMNSHHHLSVQVPKEACPLQLAPTASTTATLAMGDALTIALMRAINFQPESFARFHPGGSLGRRLLGKVEDMMISDTSPFVCPDDSIMTVLESMTKNALGMVLIDSVPLKIITDGDLRRAIQKYGEDIFSLHAQDISTNNPAFVSPKVSLQKAYSIMDERKISVLLVCDEEKLVGVLKK
ncbi:MAG: KpsF/GutQ family sugar-phosphate isomerase [Gammaproteobacteria bacterium]|nr:KpsF/GutQ family sugar-phosphate isomerase [Gammaproteobacteria bacterium]